MSLPPPAALDCKGGAGRPSLEGSHSPPHTHTSPWCRGRRGPCGSEAGPRPAHLPFLGQLGGWRRLPPLLASSPSRGCPLHTLQVAYVMGAFTHATLQGGHLGCRKLLAFFQEGSSAPFQSTVRTRVDWQGPFRHCQCQGARERGCKEGRLPFCGLTMLSYSHYSGLWSGDTSATATTCSGLSRVFLKCM